MTARRWLLAPPLLWAGYTWGSHLMPGGRIRRGTRDTPSVALTFDDGPDPEHTPRVLDILARQGVRAAFFLIGRRAEGQPALARRIVDEGHDLGNHTWSHRSLWLCGPAATVRQVRLGHEAIARAAGRAPRFFRPPWGMTNMALLPVLRGLGTPCVLWSVQPEGLRPVPAARQVERSLARVAPGAILDLHDADGVAGAGARVVEALPALIDGLRASGYALVPLSDLLYSDAARAA